MSYIGVGIVNDDSWLNQTLKDAFKMCFSIKASKSYSHQSRSFVPSLVVVTQNLALGSLHLAPGIWFVLIT